MSDYPFFMSVPESANNCFRLESGGYSTHIVEPGKLRIAGGMTSIKPVELDLKAGDERYVEIGVVDDDATVREVSAEVAKPALALTNGIETCSPSELEKKRIR